MTRKDMQIAKKLKSRISKVAKVIDFKVFGSRIKGMADENSDMDLYIEVEFLTKKIKDEIFEITWQVGFENEIVIAPLIFTREEIEKSPLRSSAIVQNIAREGVAV